MSTTVSKYELFDKAITKASKIYRLGENASKIFELSEALQYIGSCLTPEKMKSIMLLQNKKIGFKTDNKAGYPVEVVQTCIIDAMMTGVLATGNQFNIISGSMYVTKEGFFHLLKGIENLEYYDTSAEAGSFIQNKDNTANINCTVKYKLKDQKEVEYKKFYVIKNNSSYGSFDAVIGKMERKARKDLYEKLTGIELSEGEAEEYKGLDPNKEVKQNAENVENDLFKTNGEN